MIPAQAPVGTGRGELAPYRVPRAGYFWIPWLCFGLLLAVFVSWGLLLALRVVHVGGVVPYPIWQLFPFGFFFLFFVFFFVFRIGWWGYRRPWGYGGSHGRWGEFPEGAHEILRERFARGEISAEQLRAMRQELDESDRR